MTNIYMNYSTKVYMNYSNVYGQKSNIGDMKRFAEQAFDFVDDKHIDLYNIRDHSYPVALSASERYVVIMSATNHVFNEDGEYPKKEVCFEGMCYSNIRMLPNIQPISATSVVQHIYDEVGNPIVGVLDFKTFYILIHQEDFYPNEGLIVKTFKAINEYIKKNLAPLSYTEDKERILIKMKEELTNSNDELLSDKERQLNSISRDVEDRIRSLKSYYDRQAFLMREIESLKNQDSMFGQLEKDLDLIMKHEFCENVSYKDGEFYFDVKDIHCFDHDGNEYYIGDITIKVNLTTSIVRFYSEEGRKGYWSDRDPHPHVQWSSHSGDNGKACLGSSASVVAELCSQRQLYALYLSLVDFLESVNIDDPAGAKVVNWDRIVNGERMEAEGEDLSESEDHFWCESCEEYHHYDNGVEVFNELNQEQQYGRNSDTVCDDCASERYEYFDGLECYLPDGEYEEVYDGHVVPDGEGVEAWLNYNHQQGLQNSVTINCFDDNFSYWEELDTYVHVTYVYSDYFDEDGNKIDVAGNIIREEEVEVAID